jgi:hypothetical protein
LGIAERYCKKIFQLTGVPTGIRSLVVKIIIIVPFDMQSAYFRNLRSRHVILSVKPKIVTLADAMYRLASLPLDLSDEYGMINELNNS